MNIKSLFVRFNSLSTKKKLIVGAFLALSILGIIPNSVEDAGDADNLKSGVIPNAVAGIPNIEGDSDGILLKILNDFYVDNQDAKWWIRISKVVEGDIGDETAKMVYVKTDYRLDNADDVEQGTLLCNAIISHLPREGLAVRVDGLVEEGRTLLDGTVETKVNESPVTTFGSSAKLNNFPDWCVARTLFSDVREELLARGWKQQYGYGQLSDEEKKKVFEGSSMQKGPIYFKN
jgi:hypothetical protein